MNIHKDTASKRLDFNSPLPMAKQSADDLKVELLAEERYHEDRILHTERNFAAIAMAMGGVARKTALLRDKGDKLARTLKEEAAGEYGSVKEAIDVVADCLSGLEDYRQTQVDRLEAKVVKPLVEYGNICRKAKDELNACHSDRSKVVNQQRALDRTRLRDPANTRRLTQLETDLQKAKFKRLQSSRTLESHMNGFEKRRVMDLKMLFHAKALELYTVAYQNMQSANEDEAVEVFMNGLKLRKRRVLGDDALPTPTDRLSRAGSEPSLASQ